MNYEFKPCPAGHPDHTVGTAVVYVGVSCYAVKCGVCGWKGPRRRNVNDAIAAWNHRPIEDGLAKRVEESVVIAVARECADFDVIKARLKFRTKALQRMRGLLILACRERDEAIRETQQHHCPHCASAIEMLEAMLDKSQKQTVRASNERDDAQRQTAAMREALKAVLEFCAGNSNRSAAEVIAIARGSLGDDAGRDFVPRSDLAAVEKRVGELRGAVELLMTAPGLRTYCNACGAYDGRHSLECSVGKALGKEVE